MPKYRLYLDAPDTIKVVIVEAPEVPRLAEGVLFLKFGDVQVRKEKLIAVVPEENHLGGL